jgi:hypothetical protein
MAERDSPPAAQRAGRRLVDRDEGSRPPAGAASRTPRSNGAQPPLPLGPDERPAALLVAVAVAGVLALGVVISAATVHDLARHGGSLPGALFLAAVLAALAGGMYRRRYWAVLAFQALLAFQIIVTSLALVVASRAVAAVVCLASIALGGWLFWKLVRVLARISAAERAARER